MSVVIILAMQSQCQPLRLTREETGASVLIYSRKKILMLRIAMVAYTYYRSDPRVRREATVLAARGDQVEFFCLRAQGDPEEEWIDGVRVRHLRMERYRGGSALAYAGSYLRFFLLTLAELTASHFRAPYDLVHANNMPDFMAFTGLAPRLGGKALLLDIHDTMPEIYQGKFGVGAGHALIRLLKLQERLSGAFATHVLTSEHTKREALIEHGMDGDKIDVLLNLPDPAVFQRRAPAEPSQSRDGFRLVFHGTLAERLGVDIALRSVAELKGEIPGLRFDLIGDGDHRPELLRLRTKLGLEEIVHFSDGMVPVESLPEMLLGADLAVIPTREEISTRYMLPTKLVEYAAIGIPAIVAPTHTIRYYFDESQVAFFKPGDHSSLAEGIRRLYTDPQRRHDLATAAARFFERYEWESHKRVYVDLVDRLCAS